MRKEEDVSTVDRKHAAVIHCCCFRVRKFHQDLPSREEQERNERRGWEEVDLT
jgi:hypothetical protein